MALIDLVKKKNSRKRKYKTQSSKKKKKKKVFPVKSLTKLVPWPHGAPGTMELN